MAQTTSQRVAQHDARLLDAGGFALSGVISTVAPEQRHMIVRTSGPLFGLGRRR